MTQVKKLWPILTGTHRYDKSLSTRGHGKGTLIDVPLLAYLIETSNGRILYDTGCDYNKIADEVKRKQFYESEGFAFGAPSMNKEDRLENHLAELGLKKEDVDLVFCSHLHFDAAGGLNEMKHAEVHVHQKELDSAKALEDEAYFAEDFNGPINWRTYDKEYEILPGVRAVETPGHSAGHASLFIELRKGKPILLAGDAADLIENIEKEIAPGLCWDNNEEIALESIRKLKRLSVETGSEIWPNHDMKHFKSKKRVSNYFS
ncbi:MAG: N-acyl homoserine lactone hydrolase [Sulfurimonas sp.]|uniref:N-acyl homoserine lactonase family protein n=1 Tax=Sulfurimonas sp. TaxID=2022749 RepID=UPI0039E39636